MIEKYKIEVLEYGPNMVNEIPWSNNLAVDHRVKYWDVLYLENIKLKQVNAGLKWEVENWERKEIEEASCCMNNEKKAKELELEVLKLRTILEDLGR